jgi:hypothetical protein
MFFSFEKTTADSKRVWCILKLFLAAGMILVYPLLK